MAQVDPNIAMGFRPVQIPLEESPLNRMQKYADYENALVKSQEAQRNAQQRNALSRIRASGVDIESPEYLTRVSQEAPDLADIETERQLKRLQLREAQQTANLKQAQLTREQIKEAKKSLLALPNLETAVKDIYEGIQSGLLTAEQGEALRAGLPVNEEEFPNWQKQQLLGYLTVEQQLSRTEPKIKEVDIGGAIKFIDVNPNSATYNQEVGPKSIEKTPTPAAATDPELVKEYKFATDPARGKQQFKGSLLEFKEAFARAGRTPAQGDNPNKVAHTSTDDQGNVTFYNAFGQVIRTQTNAGKRSPNLIKAEQAEKNLVRDIERTSKELAAALEPGGLIDQSTGSGAGRLVDFGARFIGEATPGDIAASSLAPIADMVLKMVPRFEGPQSDKDTASYNRAAGQLADPSLPNKIRKEAGKVILRLMTERKDQFAGEGMDSSPTQRKAAPPPPTGFVPDKK
jgi:hypothetical protein